MCNAQKLIFGSVIFYKYCRKIVLYSKCLTFATIIVTKWYYGMWNFPYCGLSWDNQSTCPPVHNCLCVFFIFMYRDSVAVSCACGYGTCFAISACDGLCHLTTLALKPSVTPPPYPRVTATEREKRTERSYGEICSLWFSAWKYSYNGSIWGKWWKCYIIFKKCKI